MATHYVYDTPDTASLNQGDILKRTPELVDILTKYHPHYAQHPDYKYFMVLTQSCDLVRRGKEKEPKTPYISIGVARSLEDTLLREAAKQQEEWQRKVNLIGSKLRNNLVMFLESLLDNNEKNHFYLHEDRGMGIDQSCCVCLAISVTFRAEHYDKFLGAKIAQLKDTFQAKLGWLIGNLYSRVGTIEWNQQYQDNPMRKEIERILKGSLIGLPDDQIREGISELKKKEEYDQKTPEQVLQFIQSTKVIPRSKKLEKRAIEVIALRKTRTIPLICGRVITAMRGDPELKKNISELITAGINDSVEKLVSVDEKADKIIGLFDKCISSILTDDKLPDRDIILAGLIKGILSDANIASILN